MTDETLLTTRQVAERLGMSESGVRYMIKEHRLVAVKYGHVWLVRASDLIGVKRKPCGPKFKKK